MPIIESPTSPGRVVVVDFDMPFWSMVLFIFKWSIAAIPAMLLLVLLGVITAMMAASALGAYRASTSADISPLELLKPLEQAPSGAVARCGNGQYVFVLTASTCSGYGGVSEWLNKPK